MMKNKTKFALISSVVSLILCISMFAGTTYAWFTDSATSANNTIIAGNLDVELDYWNDGEWTTVEGSDALFSDTYWEPGHAEVVYLKLSNVGSLALKYLFSINIAREEKGINVFGEELKLSDYIQFGIVDENVTVDMFAGDREGAIEAIEEPHPISEALTDRYGYASRSGNLSAGAEKVIALVVWMPTTVGNEANHNGVYAPFIELGVNLLATQYTEEEDSFGNDYDSGATFGGVTTSAPIPDEDMGLPVEVELRDENNAKVASALFPASSLDYGKDNLTITVDKTVTPLDGGREQSKFEVEVDGIKENNDTPIKLQLRVPKGLDSAAMNLTHIDEPVTSFIYNPINGYVILETTSFSPFTVEYDPNLFVDYNAEEFPENIPTADVTDMTPIYAGNIEWAGYDVFGPLDDGQQLESIFEFKAPHDSETVEDCEYADWACDYVVSIDKDIAEGSIVLGGCYGSFGWIGFYNPVEIAANEQIPLLGSFLGGDSDWTYEMIVGFVGEFLCGVAEANDPTTELDGATFTVRLRLTNPENRDEVCDVNVVKYTFATMDEEGNVVIPAKIVIEDFTADITAGN